MRFFLTTAAVIVGVVLTLACSSGVYGYTDRIERRAGEMALPDEVLDPGWPELSEPLGVAPPPPSIDNSDDDGMYLDQAEREEIERNLIERGLLPDPAASDIPTPLGRDDELDAPPEGTFGEEYSDPSEW